MPFAHFTWQLVFLWIGAFGLLGAVVSCTLVWVFGHVGDPRSPLDHDADLVHPGSSFLTWRRLGIFAAGFGGCAAAARQYDLGVLTSMGLGCVGGAATAWTVYALTQWLEKLQEPTRQPSDVRSTELVGLTALVVVPIPEGGAGQVRCRLGDLWIFRESRTADGAAIADGETVLIDGAVGQVLVVRREQA